MWSDENIYLPDKQKKLAVCFELEAFKAGFDTSRDQETFDIALSIHKLEATHLNQ